MNLFVFQRTAVTEQGNVIPNAEITVYPAGTTGDVDLFDDAAGTPKGNPFNAGPTDGEADGFIQFYVAFGQYDIAVNGVVLWENQTIGRPELDDITSLSSLNTAALVDGQQFSVKDGDRIRRFAWNDSADDFDELPVVGHGWGIGRSFTSAAISTLVVPGIYAVDSGSPDRPASGSFIVQVVAGSAAGTENNRIIQVAYGYSSGSVGRSFIRSSFDAISFSDWQEIYNSGSILGAVTESGGMPTGALIETGESGGLTYEIFANGVARVFGDISITNLSTTVSVGSFFRNGSADSAIPLPITFLSSVSYQAFVTSGSGSPGASNDLGVFQSFTITSSEVRFYVLRETSTSADFVGQLYAIGRVF